MVSSGIQAEASFVLFGTRRLGVPASQGLEPINTIYPTLNQKFHSTVSKSGDTAVLHLNGLSENDFGSYICKAVHILGTGEKEFIVKMAGKYKIIFFY
ncbi:unnamed protein product [Schistosoma margrebowiei]|uniref:Uncharacterized protein n=1 Tax=Schistosoma margrebowiei TaxID=48269 RepID=A0A183LGS4_9TREM|nr:unnamed protein product [Schistosoma margrebowiei]